MEQTLLLNATYEPLKVVDWRKAITMLCQGKVEVVSEYDREVRSVSVTFKLPSVIRLLRYITVKRRIDYVPFSRANIYARDDHRCQYCGSRAESVDHVVPRSRGGQHTWENVVAACRRCNAAKRDRLLEETGLRLQVEPRVPRLSNCLLNTSDAADERSREDLGGRRIN